MGLWAGLGIGVLALIIVAAVVGSLPSGTSPSTPPPRGPVPGTTVNITGVEWSFSGPSYCWSHSVGAGMSVTGGSSLTVSQTLSYHASGSEPSTCTVETLSVKTSGFSLISVNTPLTVTSGSSATLSVALRAPGQNETTPLALSATVAAGTSSTSVDVKAVNWDFSGPSYCWGTMTGSGATVPGGSDATLTIRLSYTAPILGSASCTVTSVAIATAGFTLEGSNTPLTVDSGGSATLSATVMVPNQTESVVLTIDGQVTAP